MNGEPDTTRESEDDELLRLRTSLRHFPSGVTAVTVTDGPAVHGMTASSFTSVSLAPPLCSVCGSCARSGRSTRAATDCSAHDARYERETA